MNTKVECYAGSSHPETPRALVWEGRRYTVQTVLERRREPHGIGFLIHCNPDGQLFDLFYEIEADQWQIQPKGPAITDQQPIQPEA
jgi:hypothetical protein